MTVVVGCTLPAFKCDPAGAGYHPMNWGAWLQNAEAVQASVEESVIYFAALEVDARGLTPFEPLLDRLGQIPGAAYWTWSINDGVDVVDTRTRLRRICAGHNWVRTFALEETDASHVLFLASDTQARDDVLPRLLELNTPAAACHIPTYCLDGPRVRRPDLGWDPAWDVRDHMESCAATMLRRDVLNRLQWRWSESDGTTDDPSMHRDLAEFMGEKVYSRHDVHATHWPQAIPPIEHRHSDAERTVVR